jgi:hypothetical protein
MSLVKNRPLLLPAVAAIALWVGGIVATNAFSDKIPAKPSDAQILAWVQGNQNSIIMGAWLWMMGCLVLLVFAAVLRARLAEAEGGQHTASTVAFAGAVAAAVFGLLMNAGDLASAIDHDSVSATTAGAFHHLSDAFFVAAELSMILFFAGAAVVALRTGVLPRLWAYFSILIAVVLLIGPIGWAALIFGTPVWLLGTGLIVGSTRRVQQPTISMATA